MKPKSPASFSAPIWIALRLKNLQAQNKNFCRVLDIRVAQIVKAGVGAADAGHDPLELLRDRPGHQVPADLVGEHVPGGIVP